MRDRTRILQSLEGVYRETYEEARKKGDQERMGRLDLDFQRDQLQLEVLLDVRDLLLPVVSEDPSQGVASILEKAQKLRNLTRLR